MRKLLSSVLLTISVVFLTACVSEPNVFYDLDTNYVADAVRPWIESGELPGAISILCNGETREVACMGFADVAARRPITLHDAFMQCSQTKGFCGVTVAKLVEEGRLSLDDPVSKYLPEFRTLWIDAGETNGVRQLVRAKTPLTVRMCLNHTGGFPFEISAKRPEIPGGGWSGGLPLRPAAAVAASEPLLFEPGTREWYSNTGIDVAAAVVETVTGQKWEEYLRQTVLEPLGMRDTGFWPSDQQLETQIEMYECRAGSPAVYKRQDGDQQRPYNDAHVFASAGAGLWTTAEDQLKFYRMLMNLGCGDNGARILKEETVKNLLAVSSRPAEMSGYSLGLVAPIKDESWEWFGHGGAWGTYANVNWHTRQLEMWIVQLDGMPRPWDKARAQAANRFFDETIDHSALEAYTNRR